jgi:transposase
MNIRYHVELSCAERTELELLLGGGRQAVRKLKRAQILLAADAGISDDEIASSLGVGHSTVYRTRRRFVEGNLAAALSEEPRAGAERKLTAKEEALLVATTCSSPPVGRARWTLELLADEMVRLTSHDPAGRSKSPGYGHLKLPHLMTTGRAAELRPVKQDVYFRSLQPRRGWGVERLEATAAKHSIYVT